MFNHHSNPAANKDSKHLQQFAKTEHITRWVSELSTYGLPLLITVIVVAQNHKDEITQKLNPLVVLSTCFSSASDPFVSVFSAPSPSELVSPLLPVFKGLSRLFPSVD